VGLGGGLADRAHTQVLFCGAADRLCSTECAHERLWLSTQHGAEMGPPRSRHDVPRASRQRGAMGA
jgi:hypothetical protein